MNDIRAINGIYKEIMYGVSSHVSGRDTVPGVESSESSVVNGLVLCEVDGCYKFAYDIMEEAVSEISEAGSVLIARNILSERKQFAVGCFKYNSSTIISKNTVLSKKFIKNREILSQVNARVAFNMMKINLQFYNGISLYVVGELPIQCSLLVPLFTVANPSGKHRKSVTINSSDLRTCYDGCGQSDVHGTMASSADADDDEEGEQRVRRSNDIFSTIGAKLNVLTPRNLLPSSQTEENAVESYRRFNSFQSLDQILQSCDSTERLLRSHSSLDLFSEFDLSNQVSGQDDIRISSSEPMTCVDRQSERVDVKYKFVDSASEKINIDINNRLQILLGTMHETLVRENIERLENVKGHDTGFMKKFEGILNELPHVVMHRFDYICRNTYCAVNHVKTNLLCKLSKLKRVSGIKDICLSKLAEELHGVYSRMDKTSQRDFFKKSLGSAIKKRY
ncbi:MAG: hypothetical protein ACTJLM_01545 [Ehrlichia sp.]